MQRAKQVGFTQRHAFRNVRVCERAHIIGQVEPLTQSLGIIDPDSTTLEEHTRRITVPAPGGSGTLVDVIRTLDAADIRIADIGLRRPTLDDVFLTLTGHEAEQKESA